MQANNRPSADESTQTNQDNGLDTMANNKTPTQHGHWMALISVAFAAFILVTSEFLPVGVLNYIAADLNITVGTAGLVITLPSIMAAISALFLLILVKGLDRRYVLIGLTLTMIIANLITALSTNLTLLLFSRILLGISIGGFWATAIALAPRLAPPHLPIAKANAIIMIGVSLATILGVPIGTWLSEYWGWRIAFMLSAVLGGIILLAELKYLPTLKPKTNMLIQDLPALIRIPNARKGMLVILLIGLAHFSAFSYMAPFFKHVAGFNAISIGQLLMIFGCAGVFGNIFAGYSANKNVRYTLASLGICFALVFISFPSFALSMTGAYLLTAIWGFAFGAFPVTANTWMFIHANNAVEKGAPFYVALFQMIIGGGSLLGGFLIDHFHANILFYSALSFLSLAILILFTWLNGLNNPPICKPS